MVLSLQVIFEDSYLPSLDIFELKRGQGDIYMQNTDPKHNAKITKEWISCNGIKLLDCSSQYPDLNSIEHFWAILKRKMYQRPLTMEKNLKI